MKKKQHFLLAALLGVLSFPATAQDVSPPALVTPIQVHVQPNGTAVQGNPLDVEVLILGLGDGATPSLGAFDLTLSWDPTVLGFNSIGFGGALGDEAMGEALTGVVNNPDNAMVSEVSLLLPADLIANQSDTFTLFTVTFDTIMTGSTPLDLTPNDPLADELGLPLTAEFIGANITVNRFMPVADIPTLSQWGLLALIGLLLAAGIFRLK